MSLNLDELQGEIEKLLGLLNDRQPGLISWHQCMNERMTSLHTMLSAAFGRNNDSQLILKAEIDTDINPRLPLVKNVTIASHVRRGKIVIELRADGCLFVNGKKVYLNLKERKIPGMFTATAYELHTESDDSSVLSASFLDFLLDHKKFIPEEWRKRLEKSDVSIIFPDTVYKCDCVRFPFVRCMFPSKDGWSDYITII